MYEGESVRLPAVDMLRALEPEQLGVVVGVSLRKVGAAPYPMPSKYGPCDCS